MSGDDYARLGDDADGLVTWLGNEAFMRLSEDESGTASPRHCAALVIDGADGTFLCSVYERRPQVCRDLERGGGGCRGELAAKGARPARALLLARARLTRRS